MLVPERPAMLAEMEMYAKEHQIPIMELSGIEAMLQFLRIQQPAAILEIGTAIGYSALRMAFALPDVKIVTIERDKDRLAEAESYIKRAAKERQILLIDGDALETKHEIEKQAPFDCIFIDAAKGQYRAFFEMYAPFLAAGGVIISDNVLFRNLVLETEIENKRLERIAAKLHKFNSWLMNHPDYDTVIIPVGDGIAVSKKR